MSICTAALTVSLVGCYAGDPERSADAFFPGDSAFYRPVEDMAVRDDSEETVRYLEQVGGWGGGHIRIDFNMHVLRAGEDAPMRTFNPTEDFYLPDCDDEPVPMPVGGAVEGEDGYECWGGGDCHLLVIHEPSNKLYEMWRAHDEGGYFRGGCLAVWDMEHAYGPDGRGLGCASADAAGLPIVPLLIRPDEVASGSIEHALRFILPNDRIRGSMFVTPATHSTLGAGGSTSGVPFGARLRLKADYPIGGLSPGPYVVARAMQEYGIILADGGTVALTAESDRYGETQWAGMLHEDDLASIPISAFEVVDTGDMTPYSGSCTRAD